MNRIEKLQVIREIINKWDPIGLLKLGAPRGEYDLEINRISCKIEKIKNVQELADVIYNVFNETFNYHTFDRKYLECKIVAEEMWNKIMKL